MDSLYGLSDLPAVADIHAVGHLHHASFFPELPRSVNAEDADNSWIPS